jgi:hypothetical protein
MNRKFTIYFSLIFFIFFSLPFAVQAINLKDAFDPSAGKPLPSTFKTSYNTSAAANTAPFEIVAKIINTLLSILGVFFVGLMIYGGYTWMTAEGKEQKATKAKDTITAAVIGLLIIVSAYAISYFVIKMLPDQALAPPTPATETQPSPNEPVPNFTDHIMTF